MTFEQLNIIEPILKALKNEGYLEATPIQEQAIPILLSGKDILGSAQTGTGKTAAFAVPILQSMKNETNNKGRKVKALILAPTRELAAQIGECFRNYGKNLRLKTAVIFGGVGQRPQVEMLRAGIDILVATPGRLLDLINQKILSLSEIQYFVIDEADRMLDMGFIHDVNKIITLIPVQRQTMLFSATMPKEIVGLANKLLNNPHRISIAPVEKTIDSIEQTIYFVSKKEKIILLGKILANENVDSALVFSRTKHGANNIVKKLAQVGIIAEAIHGNKSQTARETALKHFKTKKIRVLIATDIAARGIDINELSHVINYDLPEVPETYIHRIGRTGRAGNDGVAYSFCSEEEFDLLKAIQKHIGKDIPVNSDYPLKASFENSIDIHVRKSNKKVLTNNRFDTYKGSQTRKRSRTNKNNQDNKKSEQSNNDKKYQNNQKEKKSQYKNYR